jgi:hypothetical protein
VIVGVVMIPGSAGLGTAGGVLLIANGLDNVQAGIRSVSSGQHKQAVLEWTIHQGVDAAGGPQWVGDLTYLGTQIVVPLSATKISGLGRASALRTVMKEGGVDLSENISLRYRPAGICFPAGTQVVMADGTTKAIEEVEIGDSVLADDPEDDKPITIGKGADVVTNYTYFIVQTDVDQDGDGTSDATFRSTRQHPFWTTNRGWVNAVDLAVGDAVVGTFGTTASVVAVTVEATTCKTWNLSIEGTHTFFIEDAGIQALVHNTNPGPRTYVIYIAPDPAPVGGWYVGRASKSGWGWTADDVLDFRYGSGHHRGFSRLDMRMMDWTLIEGGGRGSTAYNANRGAEQLIRDRLKQLGKAADQFEPIRLDHPKRPLYLRSAEALNLGPCP